MFLEISLVLVSVLFVTSCYVIWNITTKLEALEDWVTDFINTVEKIQMEIKKIDYKGYFEADDEVGVIFKQINTVINQLNRFKGEQQ
jgi:hypothetical protein|tara:strand:+ start:34 stop:294 length:261 start_codon:yes stop_codon:yes gene_type:complete